MCALRFSIVIELLLFHVNIYREQYLKIVDNIGQIVAITYYILNTSKYCFKFIIC